MKITKKVQEKYFKAILEGEKTYEVRLADFECKPGDVLVLLEQKDGTRELTGRKMECEISMVFNTKDMEKFHSKNEIEKYGLLVMAIKKKEI